MSASDVLRVEGLRVRFPVRHGWLRRSDGWIEAVRDVSLSLAPGKTLGLVGESGCGKSTTARAILQLQPAAAGQVWIAGECWSELRGSALRRARRHAQMVFQDPYASLDPHMTVGELVAEPLRAHGLAGSSRARLAKVEALLGRVGLEPAHLFRHPHELSGGQRQRVGIARALALAPALIVADEPVSALDASVRAQIINLLLELQRELGVAYLFISHDLAVVRHVADEVAVMYLGRIVERASCAELFAAPHHPYTLALLDAVPVADPAAERQRRRIVLGGEVPDPKRPPTGCPFHPRCPYVLPTCASVRPELTMRGPEHAVACHLESAPPRPAAGGEERA